MNFCLKKRDRLPVNVFIAGKRGRQGFTLIEILVAVAVFSVLMVILFSTFNMLFASAREIDKGSLVYAQARICFDRLATDLRSVYVSLPPAYKPPEFDAEPDPYGFVCQPGHDEGASLRFVSLSHLPLGGGLQAEVGRIVYYLHKDHRGQTLLLRRDEILSMPETDTPETAAAGGDPVVCENVKSLEFTCYDAQGQEYDYWDSEAREFDYATPRAVGVSLVVSQSDKTHRFQTIIDLPVYREALK